MRAVIGGDTRTCTRLSTQTPAHAAGSQAHHRDLERAGEEESGDGERHNASSDAQDNHLRDRRTLHRRVRHSAREIHHISWAANIEERSQHAARKAGGQCPTPPQPAPRIATNGCVERIRADEPSERPKRRGARQIDEKSDSEHKPEERKGDQRQQLFAIGLPTGVNTERERRSQIQDPGEREHKGERQEVREQTN